jgi:hypothetical protein
MDPMVIIGTGLIAGAVVTALSLRAGTDEDLPAQPVERPQGLETGGRRHGRRTAGELGFSSTVAEDPDSPGLLYVPVLASAGPGWRERVAGLVGLIAIVLIAATVVALAIYQAGHMANHMIEDFLGR